jgi:hypothetical protein
MTAREQLHAYIAQLEQRLRWSTLLRGIAIFTGAIMRVLFDQATPVPIRSFLEGHTVSTAAHEGWDRLQNGELLNAAEAAGFDVLLTTDKNMRYQQNRAVK